MKAIGATIEYYWGDETFHTEAERVHYTGYVSFGQNDEENELDNYGIPDNNIFYYAENEQELKDYLEYPTSEWILVNYDLEYK